jgi:DNA-binding protein HU-beta
MVTQGLATAKKVKRTMSAAARKRIANAQKLRWAKFRKSAEKPAAVAKKATVKKAAPKAAKKTAPKRKISAAAKANLVANLAKARAAKAAKKTAGEAVPF